MARKLSKVLEYAEFRNFLPVIERAKEACKNSGQDTLDHFVDYHEMIELGKGASKDFPSVKLSRHACYLIVQNADPGKEIVALGCFGLVPFRRRGRGMKCQNFSTFDSFFFSYIWK